MIRLKQVLNDKKISQAAFCRIANKDREIGFLHENLFSKLVQGKRKPSVWERTLIRQTLKSCDVSTEIIGNIIELQEN